MRVVLVNPPGPSGRGYIREGRCEQRLSSFAYRMMPISLASTAALLRSHGHSPSILDAAATGMSVDDLCGRVREVAPGLVVFAVATPTLEEDLRVVGLVAAGTNSHRTAIGLHVSALPGETLRGSVLDSVVRGEPEWTVTELADVLAIGGDLARVAGLSYRRGGGAVHNVDRPPGRDLDELPFAARELLDERRYVLPLPDRPYALVVPSRGCPHRCTFCGAFLYYGRRLRLREPGRVVDEVQEILDRGLVRDIVMWSDTFTLDRRFVLEICDEIRRRGLRLRWMCNSRVDTFDEELAGRMRRAGCDGVSFGIESGDQGMLDRMQKGTTVDQARRAVAAARLAGIPVLAHFLLGMPGETLETIRRTVAHACELDPDYAQFYCATPQPGTPLWEEAIRMGYLKPGSWSRLELHRAALSTEQLAAADLERARRRAYRVFYLRLPVIRRLAGRIPLSEFPRTILHGAAFVREWVLHE